MTDPKISALLRLKRFEQPPPGYFDQLLVDVHRRQREELLKRPLWKIAAERVQVFFSEHSMGNLSYAGAMATVLVVGVSAIGLMTPGAERRGANAVAETQASAPVLNQPVSTAKVAATSNHTLLLNPQSSSPQLSPLLNTQRLSPPQIGAPRYVIDARPVSYERVSSF